MSHPPPPQNPQLIINHSQPAPVFMSQPPPIQSQAPPMFSQARPNFVSQPPLIPPPVLSHPPPLMNQAPPQLQNQAPPVLPTQCLPTMQPPPNHQFNIPPPGYIKQEQMDNQEGYTTVMGDYGPVLVKKAGLKQEPGGDYGPKPMMQPLMEYGSVIRRQSVEKNENDYDPAMPTEGDSPGKEKKLYTTLTL